MVPTVTQHKRSLHRRVNHADQNNYQQLFRPKQVIEPIKKLFHTHSNPSLASSACPNERPKLNSLANIGPTAWLLVILRVKVGIYEQEIVPHSQYVTFSRLLLVMLHLLPACEQKTSDGGVPIHSRFMGDSGRSKRKTLNCELGIGFICDPALVAVQQRGNCGFNIYYLPCHPSKLAPDHVHVLCTRPVIYISVTSSSHKSKNYGYTGSLCRSMSNIYIALMNFSYEFQRGVSTPPLHTPESGGGDAFSLFVASLK